MSSPFNNNFLLTDFYTLQKATSMLKVHAYVAPSDVHGIGLFAGEPIGKGQVIWEFNPHFDRVMDREEFLNLCKTIDDRALEHLLSYSYKRKNRYYYLADNTRFINHTENGYNIMLDDSDLVEVALRDISPGEELLENYFISYDEDDFFNYELKNVSIHDYLNMRALQNE